jgi:hypothetical protein
VSLFDGHFLTLKDALQPILFQGLSHKVPIVLRGVLVGLFAVKSFAVFFHTPPVCVESDVALND